MKQLVILSGKGGTGKTSLAAAFAHLAYSSYPTFKAVLADVDVDASNLELVLHPQRIETHDFIGGSVAEIETENCNACGNCEQVCRFDAVCVDNGNYSIDHISCEGCAACVYQCPEEAIQMHPQTVGQWYRSDTRYGPLFHADLYPAQENSGKLVTAVKQNARLLALDENYPMIIVDGPPGIGCPVISSLSGVRLALIVTEPTLSGIHDMERVLEVCKYFGVPAMVCINKYDLNDKNTIAIHDYCRKNKVDVAAMIPFDNAVTEAMVRGVSVVEHSNGRVAREIKSLWQNVDRKLKE